MTREHQQATSLQLRIVVGRQQVGRANDLAQRLSHIAHLLVGCGEPVAGFAEFLVELNGFPVLDDRFPVLTGVGVAVSLIEVLLLPGVGARACRGQHR